MKNGIREFDLKKKNASNEDESEYWREREREWGKGEGGEGRRRKSACGVLMMRNVTKVLLSRYPLAVTETDG